MALKKNVIDTLLRNEHRKATSLLLKAEIRLLEGLT